MLEDNEIMVASRGVSDRLTTDRDFVSFKGFPVVVHTTEVHKKKTEFEGSLLERSEEKVSLSLKGRILNIPRALIKEVVLVKSQVEPTDIEMKKL